MRRLLRTPRSLMLLGLVGCASNPPPPAGTAAANTTMAASGNTTTATSTFTTAPGAPRPAQAILADAVAATGGAAAWNAHKTAHFKMETTLQGMGMGGSGERFQTRADKSLTIMEMTGLGRVREGNNGK